VPPYTPPERQKGGVLASAAAYVRVSTPEQSEALQRAAIDRAAAVRGDIDLAWFGETRSGRSWVRPELDRLRAAVFRGEFRRVYVWRLDRLTRRGVRDTLEVVEALKQAKCQLISVTEGFDFAGAMGDLLVSMLGFAAQMEIDAQMDRQTAARARLESEGRSWGRPPLESALREKIRALRAEGRSIRSISMAVKVPRSTVFGVLKS